MQNGDKLSSAMQNLCGTEGCGEQRSSGCTRVPPLCGRCCRPSCGNHGIDRKSCVFHGRASQQKRSREHQSYMISNGLQREFGQSSMISSGLQQEFGEVGGLADSLHRHAHLNASVQVSSALVHPAPQTNQRCHHASRSSRPVSGSHSRYCV